MEIVNLPIYPIQNGIWLPVTDTYEPDDNWRDRFRDELPEPPEYHMFCGDCSEFVRCDISGHECVGWCSRYDEFTTVGNIEDCWEES